MAKSVMLWASLQLLILRSVILCSFPKYLLRPVVNQAGSKVLSASPCKASFTCKTTEKRRYTTRVARVQLPSCHTGSQALCVCLD